MTSRFKPVYTKKEVDLLLSKISGGSSAPANLTEVAAASGGWNLTTSQFNISSPLWNNVYTQVKSQSALWVGGGSSIPDSVSGNWQSTYLTVYSNSATNWNYQGSDIKALTGNWNNTCTIVQDYSAKWILSGTEVDLGQIPVLSGNWNSVYTTVNSASSNWNSTYNTLLNNSGIWIDNINYLSSISISTSGNLYNIISSVSSNLQSQIDNLELDVSYLSSSLVSTSGILISTISSVSSILQSQITNNDLDISYLSGQIVSVSGSLYTTIYNVSTNLEASINSVSASIQSLTGQYEASFLTTDWVGASAPYTITILPATHYQGATKDLNVTVKEDLGSENQIVYDSPSINDNGTVTLSTNTKYNGSVIIGKLGGFTATDVTNAKKGQITCVFDGLGTVLATGLKAYVLIENNATIQGWTATGDGNTGSIVVDVWKCPYASFPPTVANTIAGSEKPTITSAKTGQDTNLTTWTTQINAGDYIGFNVDSCSTFTKASITLKISK